jgi:hypothetical protein
LRGINDATRLLPRLAIVRLLESHMNRNVQRKRRPPAAAATASPAAAIETSNAPFEATADGWQQSLDMTRTMFGASLDSSREWLEGLGEWQQAQATALRHACLALEQIAEQARRAPDWPALWASLAKLSGTQWTQAVDDGSALMERAMRIESRLVERGRTDATRLSEHWLGDAAAGATREPPSAAEFNAPLVFMSQAQAAMNEMSRMWAQALYDTKLPD